MTLTEFYDAIGGSYSDIMNRLGTEKMAMRFLFKFPNATDYSDLLKAVDEQNWPDAFRFAHNLKGVGLNLSMDKLAAAASVLCEEIRHSAPEHDITPMLADITENYNNVIANIAELQASAQ